RVTAEACLRLPLVATILSGYVPAAVALLVLTVTVEEPGPVTLEGVKVAVDPEGRPFNERVTVPANPFEGETLAVYVVLLPGVTVRVAGVAEIKKSGAGFNASVAVAV